MDRILVIDDSLEVLCIVENTLTRRGYQVLTARDGESGLRTARQVLPQLIILDVRMPQMDGYQVCRILRSERHTANIPILFLTGKSAIDDLEAGFEVGGADYLPKPFFVRELVARVESLVRRSREHIEAHPGTKLPGRGAFDHNLAERIQAALPFAVGYVDLDNFKAFNDTYGFSRGDDAITATADLLDQALSKHGSREDFLGHIGGDDFLFITSPDQVEGVCQYVIREFDQRIRSFYHPDDLSRGYLLQHDRRGRITHYPIMTVSIAVIDSTQRSIQHPALVSQIAAELKHALKQIPKSKYHVDQRSDAKQPVGFHSILMVQPEPAALELLENLATASGRDLIQSSNGAETLLIADRMSLRLIVLPADTALIDTVSLYRLLKQHPRLGTIPVLLLVEAADRRRAEFQSMLSPGDQLLTTPLSPSATTALQELLHS